MIAQWIESALAASKSDDCVIVVRTTNEVNLRFARNALTTNGLMTDTQASVIAISSGDPVRTATMTGPIACEADLADLVRRADEAALVAPAATEPMPLPSGERRDGFDRPAAEVRAEEFATIAADLGTAFSEAEAEGHLLFGFAELHRVTTWLATTAGVRHRSVEPMGRLEFTAKEPDMVNSAWVGQQTNDFTDVDIAAHHTELRRRLGWGQRRIELPAGDYETILSPGAAVDLLVCMAWSMSAKDAEEGHSAFAGKQVGSTRVGEQFTSLPLTIASDPAAPQFPLSDVAVVTQPEPGTLSVFDNGAPLARTEWFTDGRLAALVRTRSSMASKGLGGSLPFPTDNLLVDAGGTRSVDDMVAATKRGLLVTCLWYIRDLDPETLLLTGATRDGVYLIEDGEIVGMVNNFRWNESPLSLIRRCTEFGAAEQTLCREWNDWFTRAVAPAMRIPDYHMSTVSQAY